MHNSKSHKSNSEGSNGRIYEPIQAVLHGLQGQRLGNVAINAQRNDELLAHMQKVPQRGGNSEILKLMESTIIQKSNKKDKGLEQQKEGGQQGRTTISFYQQATSQTASPRGEEAQEKRNEGSHITQVTGSQEFKRIPWTMSSTCPAP
ncbi:hypothetical protein O181_009830 [Austropuccinia psidii MF-1]|uniref:Uncharacterized protein n=1 Tax=Austropuccinia psidii MF-1 TaxID=1389203 RepID=A0A9Q3BSQ3_9BASI|nr:hypothetical protein [Austropuccinia psidii MF-1]